jgi:FkbH-like protein
MQVEIEPLSNAILKRAAQLTQKTNQFNLTTRRYNEEQLAQLIAPRWRAFALRARDRFGDSGLVGFAILQFEGGVAEIDTFLLSCRVIGRTIETAFLAALAKVAADLDAVRLVGRYAPTSKNEPAREFYPSHGFSRCGDEQDQSRWELSLPARSLKCPDWIECRLAPKQDVTS